MIVDNLPQYRKRLNSLLEQYRQAKAILAKEREELAKAQSQLKAVEEAQSIVQHLAQAIQQRVHERIAEVVNRCLESIFDEPYEFSIRFDRKRGKTEAQMVFSKDGVSLEDPLNEIGGGVVDVAALALRLSCILMSKSGCRKLLVLDEPWKNIRGEGNKARTRRMLLELVDKLGLQIIINTDLPAYRLGTVIEMGE